MKKFLATLLVVAMLIMVVGCAQGTQPDDPDEAPAVDSGEKTTVTIWAWDPNFNIAIMEEAGSIYTANNPNVEIEVVDFAKGDLEQKLQTMLAAGTTNGLPDIVLVEDYNAQKYIQSYPGSFADLTGTMDHDSFASYKVSLMTVDGKIYGVPFDSGATGFYYRTDYLEDAGYSADDLQDITWDEFIEIGETVFEKTGKQMLATDPNDGGLIRVMLNGAGSWYFDDAGNPMITNNEALSEAVRIYAEIVNSPMTKITSGWGEWVGAINSGDVASITTGVWITGSVKAEASQSGQWAVAPTPRLDVAGAVNASNLGGSSWYVLESSDVKDTAIDFLSTMYAGDVDFYQTILMDRGAVGTYLPAAEGDAYAQEDEFCGGQAVYLDFAEWMDEIPELNYGLYTYEADAAILAVMPMVYDGGDIAEALQQAEDQLKSQIQ